MKFKTARIAVSAVFFAAYCIIFTGIISVLMPVTGFFTAFQAVPQLVFFMSTGALSGLVIFGAVLLSAFFFGRLYCSSVCPLGFLQDIFINIRYRVRRRFSKMPNHKIPRYIIGTAAFMMLFGGIPFLMNVLEPFSSFGRIASGVFEPVVTGMRNFLVSGLEFFDIYEVKRMEANRIVPAVFAYTAGFFVFIGVLSFFKGRLYCNLLCPFGALLGIISKNSLLALRVDEAKCNSCGLCSFECKAGCIDSETGRIDAERCIMCFNCIGACSKGAVVYSALPGRNNTDRSRRQVLKGFAAAAAVLAASSLPRALNAQNIPVVKKNPLITPPGSGSIERFKKKCIACGLCVTACPTKVLNHSVLEYGIESVFVPRLDFSADYCLYDCIRCSAACPTGAIRKISSREKKGIQIGIAKFITENCLVETHGSHCTICNEFCPTKAVSLVPHKSGVDIPKVIEEICVGCGACEFMCPVAPKAIYVEGSLIHGRAGDPRTHEGKGHGCFGQKSPRPDSTGDFPF